MKKLAQLAAAALLFLAQNATAQTPCTAFPQAEETMHVNHLRMPHLRPGAFLGQYPDYKEGAVFADYDGTPQPTAGLFNSAIWVGGLDSAGKARVSAMTFPSEHRFYFVGLTASECGRWDRFWSVSRATLAAHRTDVSDGNLDAPLPEILAWPGRGNPHFSAANGFDLPSQTDDYAPFFDADGDGKYDPFAGDFPHPAGVDTALVPGKIVWNLFSDPAPGTFLPPQLPGMGGFEYQWTAWATACADTLDVLNDAVFFSLRLTNRSGERRDSVVAGIWSDFEIGREDNDAHGTAPALNTLYGFNFSKNDSISWWSAHINASSKNTMSPAVAWTVLNRPLFKTMHYMGSWIDCAYPPTLEPDGAMGYYNTLNARWKDGRPVVRKREGYPYVWPDSLVEVTDFVFDGNPIDSSGWTIFSPDLVVPICSPHQLASVYLGQFLPNASETIDYAYSYHRGAGLDHLGNVGYLFQRVADLRQRYGVHFAPTCDPEPRCEAADCVWPGDANRDGIVNHCDLLPIGASLGKTGLPRPGYTTWDGKTAPDWGQLFNQTYDLKHADANGDGAIGLPDANVVRDFYGQKTPDYQAVDEYPAGDEIYLQLYGLLDLTNVSPGTLAILAFRLKPQTGIRGVAFSVEFDTVYWEYYSQPDPVMLADFNVYRILLRQDLDGRIDFGEFRFDQDFGTSFGASNLLLRSKSLPPNTPPLTYVRLKNIKGIRADGSEVALGSWPRQFCFGGGCAVGTSESLENQAVRVFPNPAAGLLHVETDGEPLLWMALCDAAGRTLRAVFLEENAPAATCSTDGLPSGLYFLKIKTSRGLAARKVLVE